MQGGSRLQFAMVPMNLSPGKSADYIVTGTWGKTALDEAQRQGTARAVCSIARADNFNRLPGKSELDLDPQSRLRTLHFERDDPGRAVSRMNLTRATCNKLVCDASSDFLCRPSADGEVRVVVCMCPEECRAGRE